MTQRSQRLLLSLPPRICARIEVAKWQFSKRDDSGRVQYRSPFPLPFDYGSTPLMAMADGDLDILVLDRSCSSRGIGTELDVCPVAVAHFMDAGRWDPKVIARIAPKRDPLSRSEALFLGLFFRALAFLKTISLGLAQTEKGAAFGGLVHPPVRGGGPRDWIN